MGKLDFPVVGIGASAGGLQSLQNLFENLPNDTGMAFVVIVHLAPQKTSALPNIISSHTTMDVEQVSTTTKIEPNHIYVIPPDKKLRIENGRLKLSELDHKPKAVIDIFFRSLAQGCREQAVGIILSGAGSDGTLGFKSIKEYNGVTMVQDPKEAEYDAMPRSAIATGLVDFVFSTKQLAEKLIDHKEFLGKVQLPLQEKNLSAAETTVLKKIFNLLASHKGHDFSLYKRTSVLRRLQRRMHVTGHKGLKEYADYLQGNPEEFSELFKDLLINVTYFFRDPESFKALKKQVIPEVFAGKESDEQIRIWVVGCATGEEVYSLAMLLHEYASTLDYFPQIKIFGTDISEEALRIARKGFYPESIIADVPEKYLKRYFNKEESGYQIRQEIREMVLISKHNIISDPPFSRLDMISCRNLLIYFDDELQSEVLKILQYALRPGGFLFLGMSESTISTSKLFDSVNKKNALYKTNQIKDTRKELPRFLLWQNMKRGSYTPQTAEKANTTFEQVHYSLLAEQYGPASIIINTHNEAMHFSKGVDQFLQYGEGEPTQDLLKMVNVEIQRPLRTLLFRFDQQENLEPIAQKIKVHLNDNLQTVQLQVRPIDVAGFPKGYRQVVFEKIEQSPTTKQQVAEDPVQVESELVEQLEAELERTKEQLQQTVEEYETSNEELMASNEELQSMNEELQTTTEELETSQEELQSVNEELRAVNQELEDKIDQLQELNNDLKNLMETTEIGIIFVDRDLQIRRFTSKARQLFNFIHSDIGRPLSDVTHQLNYPKLIADVKMLLNNNKPIEKQISSEDNKHFSCRIMPYKTENGEVEGAVLTFLEITDLKKAEEELEEKIEVQKNLQQDLLRIDKKERWSLGQFLHDEISQDLLAAKTLLDANFSKDEQPNLKVEELENIRELILNSLDKIRELSHFVLPLQENIGTGAEALQLLAKQTRNVYDVECTVSSDKTAKNIKNPSLSSSLYYIAQEAVNNAIKHGQADKIEISLTTDEQFLILQIHDNGRGYQSDQTGNGEGINIMKYRAELWEGSFEIQKKTEEGGTLVTCSFPMEKISQD